MSIVTKSIVNADAEARYLSPGELDRIKSFVASGEARLRIAQTLTESRERIVQTAGPRGGGEEAGRSGALSWAAFWEVGCCPSQEA